jgi:MFS superfamily sulfate permease-like transporter
MSVRVEEVPLDADDHRAEEQDLLSEHIVAYRLDGPLFFAAAHRFLLELSEVADVRVIILRTSRVSTLDASGALVLGGEPPFRRATGQAADRRSGVPDDVHLEHRPIAAVPGLRELHLPIVGVALDRLDAQQGGVDVDLQFLGQQFGRGDRAYGAMAGVDPDSRDVLEEPVQRVRLEIELAQPVE